MSSRSIIYRFYLCMIFLLKANLIGFHASLLFWWGHAAFHLEEETITLKMSLPDGLDRLWSSEAASTVSYFKLSNTRTVSVLLASTSHQQTFISFRYIFSLQFSLVCVPNHLCHSCHTLGKAQSHFSRKTHIDAYPYLPAWTECRKYTHDRHSRAMNKISGCHSSKKLLSGVTKQTQAQSRIGFF